MFFSKNKPADSGFNANNRAPVRDLMQARQASEGIINSGIERRNQNKEGVVDFFRARARNNFNRLTSN